MTGWWARLPAPGFDVVDLDKEVQNTRIVDLLVSMSDHRPLIKIKSEGQNACESIVHDLRRHVQTWPEDLSAVACLPSAINIAVSKPTVPHRRIADRGRRHAGDLVIAVRGLFDWWRTEDLRTVHAGC